MTDPTLEWNKQQFNSASAQPIASAYDYSKPYNSNNTDYANSMRNWNYVNNKPAAAPVSTGGAIMPTEGIGTTASTTATSQSPDFWSMEGVFGDENTMGWGGAALGAAQLGMNAWLGMENLGVARDALAFQKSSFTDQFNNQAGITNAELRQRQEWRNRQNPESIPADEYMETARVNLI